MGRIFALDYGRARIGVARADLTRTIASPFATIKASKQMNKTIDSLMQTIPLDECEAFVVGLPLHLSGKESEMSSEVRAFAALLEEKTGKPIHLRDERLSSKEIDRTMREGAVSRKKRAQAVDALSACLLLQGFLDEG